MTRIYSLLSLLAALMFLCSSASAELVISEFMASSSFRSGFLDEDNESSDWIEVQNTGAEAVDLAGHYLTDDPARLSRWQFPKVVLDGGQFLVVFASGKDRAEEGAELHTDFRLSSRGDYVALVAPDGQTILHDYAPVFPEQFEDESYGLALPLNLDKLSPVPEGGDVRWLIPSAAVEGWSTLEFDDASWTAGKTGLGYGYDGLVGEGGDIKQAMQGVNASAYARIPFQIEEPAALVTMTLRMKFEDGFVAFLNGEPIAGMNDPEELLWESKATGSHSDSKAVEFVDFPVDFGGKVVQGTNVLAIQIMNTSSGGSDLLMLPQLDIEVRDLNQELAPGYLVEATPGAANSGGIVPGPLIIGVTENPEQPASGTALPVSARVIPMDGVLTGVTLVYRLMYEDEASMPMTDDGQGGDTTAGDGIYTAAVPADVIQAGKMIRWKVMATDEAGNQSSSPAFRNEVDSHEWYGTVPVNAAIETKLTVFHWFVERASRAASSSGTDGSIFYLGEFYDNVHFDIHGQSTQGGNFVKKSYNVDFPDTQRFKWSEEQPIRVKDINLMSNWADKAKVRHTLAYEVLREAGVAAHFAFPVRVEQNGEFYSVYEIIEDPDNTYLERAGLNPRGALYKMYNTFHFTSNARSGAEKKTRKWEGTRNEDLTALAEGIRLRGAERKAFIMDHVDIPKTVNYLATNLLVSNTDCCHKNYYFYRDTDNTNEWAMLPWDIDITYGRRWTGTHNYFDDRNYTDATIILGTNNGFVNAVLGTTGVKDMVLRRVRSVSDRWIQEPGTPMEERWLERRFGEMLDLIDPDDIEPSDADLDWEKWGTWTNHLSRPETNERTPYRRLRGDALADAAAENTMQGAIQRIFDQYAEQRREFVYERNVGRGARIPQAQAGFVSVDYQPLVSSGDQSDVLVPSDGSLGDSWIATDFTPTGWTKGPTGIGFERSGDDFQEFIGIDIGPTPASDSVYMRVPFTIADASVFSALELRMQYDDGFIAYLNGTKIAEENAPGSPSWDSAATGSHSDSKAVVFETVEVSEHVSALVNGTNVLSIQAFNTAAGSDMLMVPELHGGVESAAAGQPMIDIGKIEFSPASGNQDEEYIELINNNEISVDISNWKLQGAVNFEFEAGTVIPDGWTMYLSPNVTAFRARAESPKGGEGLYVEGNYSGHLSSFAESLDLLDADGNPISSGTYEGNPSDVQKYLVISELMYNPKDNLDAEFIELQNISDSVTLDLSGIKFTAGVFFDFTGGSVTTLAPGASVLVVRNLAAFRAVYGNSLDGIIAGEFTGNTGLNNGGEMLKLEDPTNDTIAEFTYDDTDPWPTGADGEGLSLELVSAGSRPDPGDAANWRVSATQNGTPGDGFVGSGGFTGDPNADDDNDSLSRFLEYALGTSDSDATSGMGALTTGIDETGRATFRYQRSKTATDVAYAVEVSATLDSWNDGATVLEPTGTETLSADLEALSFRTKEASSGQLYIRLRVTKR